MKARELHSWQVSVAEAKDIQRRLAAQVSKTDAVREPRLIAGADISAPGRRGVARGAVVVVNYPGLEVVETSVVEESLSFPYVPGLLSFRESPLVLAACAKLRMSPDLLLVDGQGLAHPRRFGLASHLGLLLDMPAIGCAKSRLCGSHASPGAEPGSYAELVDGGEVVGVVLRTKEGSPPLYVSIGHKVDLASAIKWVMCCCRGHRLPEPTRLAHLAAGGQLPAVKAPEESRQSSLF